MAAFTQRQATPKKNSDYRGTIRKFESSDEDDSSDEIESDEEQSWKRQKTSRPSVKPPAPGPPARHSDPWRERGNPEASFKRREPQGRDSGGGGGGKRRRNNIWGSVVTEQNQESVERELTHFGVEAGMERDVESYFRQSQQLQLGALADKPVESEGPKGRKLIREVGEDKDDAWLAPHSPESSEGEESKTKPHDDLREKLKKRGSMVADEFRRTHVKSRLGSRPDEPIQDVVMQQVEIDPDSEPKVVAGQLAFSLQEPKRDLVLRIVKVLGVKKAIAIWKETEEIENDGGMMIRNQSRRRSPGGVYIQLMKTDPDVTKDDIKLIFEEEKKVIDAERKKRRKHTRKQAGHSFAVDHHGNENAEEVMDDGGDACLTREPSDETEMSTEMDVPSGHQDVMPTQVRMKQDDLGMAVKKEEKCDSDMEERFPIPQQECPDIKEENGTLFSVPIVIPKRNADSEPEDGEVIDDDDDD